METVTEKKYICEYCRSEYSSMRAALDCQTKCRQRSVSRQQWYDKHKPKYKVGTSYTHRVGYFLIGQWDTSAVWAR